MPKLSVDSKLEERADQAAEVVTQDLAQNFVDLSGRRLSTDAGSELGFNHMERRFHIRPLVVVLKEFFAIVGKELKHSPPQLAAARRNAAVAGFAPIPASGVVVRLKRNKRKRTSASNSLKVGVADIAAISGDSLNVEPLLGGGEERG